MLLITLLICLGLQRYLHLYPVHRVRLYQHYFKLFAPGLAQGSWLTALTVVCILGLPIAIIALLQMFFGSVIFGLIHFLLTLLVVWICIDGRDQHTRLKPYHDACANQDVEQQKSTLQAIFHDDVDPQAVPAALLTHATNSLFSLIFWYVILGPLIVLFYTGLVLLKQHTTAENTPRLYRLLVLLLGLLDWLPVRLLALSFALVGHFVTAFSSFAKGLLTGFSHNDPLLLQTSFASSELDIANVTGDVQEIEKISSLLNRALVLWLVVLAVLTLTGWIF